MLKGDKGVFGAKRVIIQLIIFRWLFLQYRKNITKIKIKMPGITKGHDFWTKAKRRESGIPHQLSREPMFAIISKVFPTLKLWIFFFFFSIILPSLLTLLFFNNYILIVYQCKAFFAESRQNSSKRVIFCRMVGSQSRVTGYWERDR